MLSPSFLSSMTAENLHVGMLFRPSYGCGLALVVKPTIEPESHVRAILELEGEQAFSLAPIDPYQGIECVVFKAWRVEVEPNKFSDVNSTAGPNRIGSILFTGSRSAIFGTAGNGQMPRVFDTDGKLVTSHSAGVLFPTWRIVVGESDAPHELMAFGQTG